MCKVTGGSFMMGAPDGEIGIHPRHRVRLSSFYMDQLEVTNAHTWCPSISSGRPSVGPLARAANASR